MSRASSLPAAERSASDRRVAIVAVEGCQSLDVTGPAEVFDGANSVLDHRYSSAPRYRVELVGEGSGLVRSESGLGLHADAGWSDLDVAGVDTLLVAGGLGVHERYDDVVLLDVLRRAAQQCRRLVSVCTGSFLLAEAGVLDGRRATTHWSRFEDFERRYPKVTVDHDALFVTDGRIATSAGVTAGIDLALALVEADHGTDVAQTVARHLVMFLRRPGGQSQFCAPVWAPPVEAEPIQRVRSLIHAEPGSDLSVGVLAAHAGMSERNFTRVFSREIGDSPGRYVERVRIDEARRALEHRSSGVAAIARDCGFGTAETMRRAFLRHVGVAPSEYRHRFTSTPTAREAS